MGYVDRMRAKYTAKWGVQLAGMIFQTRSSDKTVICNFLAYLYEEGCLNREYGNPKDLFEEIVRPIPFFYLGNMYAKGIGVSKNIKKALNYYESAVNIGHKEAMYELYSI